MTAQNRICPTLSALAAETTGFIRTPLLSEADFNRRARALFAFQHEFNAPYRRLCDSHGRGPANVGHWSEIPAAPAAAFKALELTVLPPAERASVFHSSGTTGQAPSRHFHARESLTVYEASLRMWFEPHLRVADSPALRLLFLTPPPAAAPHSSLVHMFETIRRAHPARHAEFFGEMDTAGTWTLRLDALAATLNAPEPVALLGTAFNFVHLLDHLVAAGRGLVLPPGSRILETGGYKGRSRTLPKEELHAALSSTLGVPRDHIITEYGMSELSSQAYDAAFPPALISNPESQISNPPARRFHFPPWARVQIISPETGREVGEGEPGLVRIFDLANIASVLAVQTEDLALRRGDGFELLGRAPVAEPRGCSLMTA